jgi:hypothetical protein
MRVEFFQNRDYLSTKEPFTRSVDLPIVPAVGDEVVFEGADENMTGDVERTVASRSFVIAPDGTAYALVRVA